MGTGACMGAARVHAGGDPVLLVASWQARLLTHAVPHDASVRPVVKGVRPAVVRIVPFTEPGGMRE